MYNWEQSVQATGVATKRRRQGLVVHNPRPAADAADIADALAAQHDQRASLGGAPTPFAHVRGLSKETAAVLGAAPLGFAGLLPCQAQSFKGIHRRRDVVLHARTGSGKTLAYLLPIVERYAADRVAAAKLLSRVGGRLAPAAPPAPPKPATIGESDGACRRRRRRGRRQR